MPDVRAHYPILSLLSDLERVRVLEDALLHEPGLRVVEVYELGRDADHKHHAVQQLSGLVHSSSNIRWSYFEPGSSEIIMAVN